MEPARGPAVKMFCVHVLACICNLVCIAPVSIKHNASASCGTYLYERRIPFLGWSPSAHACANAIHIVISTVHNRLQNVSLGALMFSQTRSVIV